MKKKQQNSSMCLVCGLDNDAGLHASFYELDNGELLGLYRPRQRHQGHPGRLHGGVAAALLDETIGRAIMTGSDENVWGLSVELTTRFTKPLALDRELRILARVTRDRRRVYEGTGEILLADGSIAAEGRGKYLKVPLEKIAEPGLEDFWKVVPSPEDPGAFDFEDADR